MGYLGTMRLPDEILRDASASDTMALSELGNSIEIRQTRLTRYGDSKRFPDIYEERSGDLLLSSNLECTENEIPVEFSFYKNKFSLEGRTERLIQKLSSARHQQLETGQDMSAKIERLERRIDSRLGRGDQALWQEYTLGRVQVFVPQETFPEACVDLSFGGIDVYVYSND